MDAMTMTNGSSGATLATVEGLAQHFVKSGFFQDAKDVSKAVVKILAGQELGFPPMASMTGVHVIQGKITLSANLMAAAIKRSGKYDYRVTRMDDEGCTVVFMQGGETIGESSFTMADARSAGLMSNPTWKKFARNMLFARALSNGARWYCPDIFGGPMYTPEEMGATVDGETGEVVGEIDHAPPALPEPRVTRDGNGRGRVEGLPGDEAQPPATADTPPHWSPLIDEAADYAALQALLGRIMRTDPSPRRFNAMKACAERMANAGTVAEIEATLAGLDRIPADSPSRQGVPAIEAALRQALDVLYAQAADVDDATGEAVAAMAEAEAHA